MAREIATIGAGDDFSPMADKNENDGQRNINQFHSGSGDNVAGDKIIFPPEPRDGNETILLEAVRTEVAGRQELALHNRVYIELDKREDPSKVVRPWDMDVKEGSAEPVRCPPDVQIAEIFDRPAIGGRLLLLGAPGSGKTTMLLQLAEVLVDRAVMDRERPVPVLLNLSAWKTGFKDIRSWMVADLKLKYGVKKSKAEEWIEERRIVPLLDGLDELMSERQETCVRALNEFLAEWRGSSLVVCSRLEEYGAYPTDLQLNGSVTVLPLSTEQIEWYLRRTGCGWLWEVVKDDSAVMNEETGLARSSLMLTVLVLASEELRGCTLEEWLDKDSETEQRPFLFEAYIRRQLKRPYAAGLNLLEPQDQAKGLRKPYRDEVKIRRYLGWLARRSREKNQTEIFIENLQPIFIKKRWQHFIFGSFFGLFFMCLIVLIGALFTWLSLGFLFGVFFALTGLLITPVVVLFFGLVDGLFFVDDDGELVDLVELNFHVTPQRILSNIPFYGVVGLIVGFPLGLLIEKVYDLLFGQLDLGPSGGLQLGLTLGLVMGVIFGLTGVLTQPEIAVKRRDNQGIYQQLINSLFFGIIFSPLGIAVAISFGGTSGGKFLEIISTPVVIFAIGILLSSLMGAFIGGMINVVVHIALRCTLWLFGYSPWNYSRFLRYCTERGFLQRIGGGYRFVHGLLRDHFANIEPCPGDPTAPPAR